MCSSGGGPHVARSGSCHTLAKIIQWIRTCFQSKQSHIHSVSLSISQRLSIPSYLIFWLPSATGIKSAYQCTYDTELTGFDYLLLPACGQYCSNIDQLFQQRMGLNRHRQSLFFIHFIPITIFLSARSLFSYLSSSILTFSSQLCSFCISRVIENHSTSSYISRVT